MKYVLFCSVLLYIKLFLKRPCVHPYFPYIYFTKMRYFYTLLSRMINTLLFPLPIFQLIIYSQCFIKIFEFVRQLVLPFVHIKAVHKAVQKTVSKIVYASYECGDDLICTVRKKIFPASPLICTVTCNVGCVRAKHNIFSFCKDGIKHTRVI